MYNIKTLVNKSIYYSEFANKVYQYLNGRINTKNISAGMVIKEFSENLAVMNFAYLTLYLSSIIIEKEEDDEKIKTEIVFIIAHELSHFDQFVDTERYINDRHYTLDIENQANKRASQFVFENYYDIVNNCGLFSLGYISKLYYDMRTRVSVNYREATLEEIYKMHMATSFSINDYDKYEYILIEHFGKEVYIKCGDHYNPNTLEVNTVLMTFNENNISKVIRIGRNKDVYILQIASVEGVSVAATKPLPNPIIYHGG